MDLDTSGARLVTAEATIFVIHVMVPERWIVQHAMVTGRDTALFVKVPERLMSNVRTAMGRVVE